MSGFESFTRGLVVITCPAHGESAATANVVLQRRFRCEECGKSRRHPRVRPFHEFQEAVRQVHGDKYDIPYPEEYENRKSWITLVCPTHGVFSKKGQKLLSGQGCAKCRAEEMKVDGTLSGGYNETLFKQDPQLAQQPARVYYLRVGSAYKVGITRHTIKSRIRHIRWATKLEPEVLDEFDCTLEEAYRLEQTILKDFHLVRTYEMWSTEVFREDVMQGVSLEEYYNTIKEGSRP